MGFDLAMFVNNLTDEYYEPFATNALGAIGDQGVAIAPPRMWGAELRIPFGAMGHE